MRWQHRKIGSLTAVLVSFCIFLTHENVNAFQSANSKVELLVFILAGQSNMQGHAKLFTLPHLATDESTSDLHRHMVNKDGSSKKIDGVWISYLSRSGVKSGQLSTGYGADSGKIGPELAFGIRMKQKYNRPILLIKTAWGGKSLNTDFRPPSAKPFQFPAPTADRLKKQGKDVAAMQKERQGKSGAYYKMMMNHIQKTLKDPKKVVPNFDPAAGYRLGGFVWFQGWNDMVDGSFYPNRGKDDGYGEYSKLMSVFIRDVRKDLKSPNLPFVIGVLGVNGPTEKYGKNQKRYQRIHQNFRDAMAAPASLEEFQGNVHAVLTEKYWDQKLSELVNREAKIRSEVRRAVKDDKVVEFLEKSFDKKELDQSELAFLEKHKGNKRKLGQLLTNLVLARSFTASEMATLKTGKSNAGFHYLGSAKILSKIGSAFADEIKLK